jgi:hypothetical protein
MKWIVLGFMAVLSWMERKKIWRTIKTQFKKYSKKGQDSGKTVL